MFSLDVCAIVVILNIYIKTATDLHDHPPRGSGAGSRYLTQSLVVDAAVDKQRVAQDDGQLPHCNAKEVSYIFEWCGKCWSKKNMNYDELWIWVHNVVKLYYIQVFFLVWFCLNFTVFFHEQQVEERAKLPNTQKFQHPWIGTGRIHRIPWDLCDVQNWCLKSTEHKLVIPTSNTCQYLNT